MPDSTGHKKSMFSLLLQTGRFLTPLLKRKWMVALSLSTLLMLLDFIGIAILIRIVWALAGVNSINFKFSLPFFSEKSELTLVGILALLFVIKNLISLLIYRFIQKLLYQISLNLAESRTRFLLQNRVDYEHTDSSKEVNQLFNISFYFPDVILTSIIQLFNELLMAISMILLAVYLSDNQLILILLILLPTMYAAFYFIRKKLGMYGQEINRNIPLLYNTIQDNVHGNADIRLNRKEEYFTNRLSDLLKKVHRMRRKSSLAGTQLTFRILESVVVMFLFALLWLNRNLTGTETMIAQLSTLGVIGVRIIPSLTRILGSANQLHQYRFVLEGLAFSHRQKKEPLQPTGIIFDNLKIENISFAYHPGQPILKNIHFQINRGEIVGISGNSGSGKSTLAALLTGLMAPDSGEILMNGEPTHDLPVHQLIKVSMVQQEIHLLKGNIAQNIALSYDEPVSKEKIQAVLKKSALASWVDTLPDGINTQVGEWGNLISGGQKQRLAIARALYHEADLIIFDEATRALDHQTELEILDTIRALSLQGKAIVIISHNKDVLSIANKIIPLDSVS
jgi:ATP-binding cassette subfamily B protein